ncbi:hypothetical protein [Symbioplanes lichenis]|uniref:hypothetical protein n=1 Tax=Symbioplanes lichenis TaxID=1629072 RepID=UPI002739F03E|nr:hypothetical protein [Actinoplanes lichenis]
MSRRCLALAGAVLAGGLVGATPAAAAVRYDPQARTGFVGVTDIRGAFGWSGRTLAERAAGLEFDHNFFADDTYSVTCGAGVFPVVHHREFGRYQLNDTVTRTGGGYGGGVAGFRLTGPIAGISGTSVAPAAGQPCPERPGALIAEVRLTATTVGWTLSVSSEGETRELLRH